MKRKISWLLVLALVVSLVPMSVFAASDNNFDRVAKVKDDANLAEIGAPILKIENDKGDWGAKETITLKLENAEWLNDGDAGVGADFVTALTNKIDTESVDVKVYNLQRKSGSRLELTVEPTIADAQGKIKEDAVIKVPMWVEMNGEAGKVTIESKSGKITEGTYIFAQGKTGETSVFIDDTVTFSNTKTIENITIEENAIKAIDVENMGEKYIKLKLDKDFHFVLDNNSVVSGDLLKGGNVQLADANGNLLDTTNVVLDKEELKIYFKGNKPANKGIALQDARSQVTEIEFIGLKVKPSKDAKEGKVNVTISSDMSEIKTTKLEIGEYADYKVNIATDGDAKEIYSGRYEVSMAGKRYDNAAGTLTVDEEHELQTLVIDEKVEGSWVNNKSITVEFPSWVKILGVDKAGKTASDVIHESIDKNEYEFEIKNDVTGKKKVELTFYVSVEAGKSGEIEAVIGGRALDEEKKVVLGEAVAPIKVEAEVAPIKAGVRDQEIGDITITEVKAGAIKEDAYIVLELDKDMDWDDEPEVEVTNGDLEIDEDDIKVTDNVLTIRVSDESTEVSTIKITKARVKVDRAIAEGSIKLEVKGSALIQNGYDKDIHGEYTDNAGNDLNKSDLLDDYGMFNNNYYTDVEVANVITPADPDTGVPAEIKFVIDQEEYRVGDETKTADVAPYIQDGRTMLSVRYVAEAIGVADNNIIWNEAARTVTIFKGDRIAQVEIGSNKLFVNGVEIPMDTVAVIKDGRTMLPVSFIAKALGLDVQWDGATRTVTIK